MRAAIGLGPRHTRVRACRRPARSSPSRFNLRRGPEERLHPCPIQENDEPPLATAFQPGDGWRRESFVAAIAALAPRGGPERNTAPPTSARSRMRAPSPSAPREPPRACPGARAHLGFGATRVLHLGIVLMGAPPVGKQRAPCAAPHPFDRSTGMRHRGQRTSNPLDVSPSFHPDFSRTAMRHLFLHLERTESSLACRCGQPGNPKCRVVRLQDRWRCGYRKRSCPSYPGRASPCSFSARR